MGAVRSFQGRFVSPHDGSVFEGYVVCEGGRVVDRTSTPSGEVSKLEGYTLPGLIDAHIHICMDGGPDPVGNIVRDPFTYVVVRAVELMRQHLQAGVTTVRDLGSPGGLAIHLRDAVNRGLIQGPRIWACGHNLTISGGHGWQFGKEADGPDGVRQAARAELKAGADGLKFMATGGVITPGVKSGAVAFSVDEMRAGIQEAHHVGKRTTAHAQSLIGVKNALDAGMDTIEHGPFDRWDEAGLQQMLHQQAILIPTIAPREVVLGKDSEARRVLPKWLIEKAEAATKNHPETIAQAYKAGVKIAAGTDAGVPMLPHGLLAKELQAYEQLGFSKLDVLRSATVYAAEALGWSDIGALEPGCWADMVVLESNPLESTAAYTQVKQVIKSGEALNF